MNVTKLDPACFDLHEGFPDIIIPKFGMFACVCRMRVRLCVCVNVLCMNVGVWVCVVCGMYAIWWKHLFKASQNNMGADILNILSTVGIKDLSPAVFTPGSTS